MNILSILEKKKNSLALNKEEINYFVENYTTNKIPDYQISALLMAILLNGMEDEEMIHLTEAMVNSGDVLKYDFVDKLVVDKHSTGGVGDKTSLVLIPLLASLGFVVAKMSGRGLGHTGGTIDKLESIKGFSVNISEADFKKQIKEIGCALVGQTDKLVPADKKLYALRDVTTTVDSLPLIASSIMSKKIALGSDIIILDVKYGSGSFMKTQQEAEELAKKMCIIGNEMNKKTISCITYMEQPLGSAVGNALEVEEAINTLKNNDEENQELKELSISIAKEFLFQKDKTLSDEKAQKIVEEKFTSGSAYNKFKEWISYQNGKISEEENLPKAQKIYELKSEEEGYIEKLEAIDIGNAAKLLGAGRRTKDEVIDLSVGIKLIKKIGNYIEKDDILALIYYNDEIRLKSALSEIKKAYKVSKNKIEKPKTYRKNYLLKQFNR